MGKFVLCLDKGHRPGVDPGAVGVGGIVEAKINNNVLTLLLAELAPYKNELTVVVSPQGTLTERAQQANKVRADLFISIHHNAGGGDGYDIYTKLNSPDSTRFAGILAKHYRALGQKEHTVGSKRGKNGDYYGVLRPLRCPGIISELCFIDSDDVKIIDTLNEQKDEAVALRKAVVEFFGLKGEVA